MRKPLDTPVTVDAGTLDEVFELWVNDERDKVTHADFAYAFGTLLGDFLVRRLDFEWKIITDENGEDFCLKSPSPSWETYPISYVWKRVNPDDIGNEHGFFWSAWDLFSGKVPKRDRADLN